MNDKIKNALGGSGGSVSVSEKPTAEPVSTEKDADVSDSNESKIVTTEEELEAYFIIKNLLKDVVDLQDITYKDTESYINILYKKNTRKWICRLKLTDTVKTLIVPDEEKKGQKFNLTSVYDSSMKKRDAKLHPSFQRCLPSRQNASIIGASRQDKEESAWKTHSNRNLPPARSRSAPFLTPPA